MKKDLYAEVTERIIEQLEQGIIPWRKPWTGIRGGAISHATGRAYSILNQFLLCKPGEYLTFNQCKAEGGHVKKGAKAKTVVFWKVYQTEEKDESGQPLRNSEGAFVVRSVPVLRYFQVFHIDDCEGIAPKWDQEEQPTAPEELPDAEKVLHDYIDREGIYFESVRSDRAYYSPLLDKISVPLIEQFDNAAEYYGTAFHEATHSTGHRTRLNRFDGKTAAAAFGSEEYSKEELVAEIGSACILHEMGIETPDSFKNSAAYVQSWLRALKNDKRLIVSAAGKAEKAARMILNIQENAAGSF